jgi:hypothetical protein
MSPTVIVTPPSARNGLGDVKSPVICHAAELTLQSVVGAEDAVRGTVISSDDGHRACNGFTSSTSRRRDFGQ